MPPVSARPFASSYPAVPSRHDAKPPRVQARCSPREDGVEKAVALQPPLDVGISLKRRTWLRSHDMGASWPLAGTYPKESLTVMEDLMAEQFYLESPSSVTGKTPTAFAPGTGWHRRSHYTVPAQRAVGAPTTALPDDDAWVPSADVYEEGSFLVIDLELPGIARNDMQVEVTRLGDADNSQSRLMVSGFRRATDPTPGRKLLRERSEGRFARVFTLPEGHLSLRSETRLTDGVLSIRVPFEAQEDTGPRTSRIEIAAREAEPEPLVSEPGQIDSGGPDGVSD